MFGSIGMPELLILLVPMVFWIAIMAAVVWGLITINRIRRAQDAMASTLESIVAELRRGRVD